MTKKYEYDLQKRLVIFSAEIIRNVHALHKKLCSRAFNKTVN